MFWMNLWVPPYATKNKDFGKRNRYFWIQYLYVTIGMIQIRDLNFCPKYESKNKFRTTMPPIKVSMFIHYSDRLKFGFWLI